MPIPPAQLPSSVQDAIQRAAEAWFASADRPRPSPEVVRHWDGLLAEWLADRSCPLLIRKGGTRGGAEVHSSGRTVVCVDNSPAHWTFACALLGERSTKAELLAALESGRWPVGFATTKAEAAAARRYRGRLGDSPEGKALNQGRWKVCHIQEVGLRSRGALADRSLETLEEHCRRLLAPSNMFLVPNGHAGFGELPEVIAVFSRPAR